MLESFGLRSCIVYTLNPILLKQACQGAVQGLPIPTTPSTTAAQLTKVIRRRPSTRASRPNRSMPWRTWSLPRSSSLAHFSATGANLLTGHDEGGASFQTQASCAPVHLCTLHHSATAQALTPEPWLRVSSAASKLQRRPEKYVHAGGRSAQLPHPQLSTAMPTAEHSHADSQEQDLPHRLAYLQSQCC